MNECTPINSFMVCHCQQQLQNSLEMKKITSKLRFRILLVCRDTGSCLACAKHSHNLLLRFAAQLFLLLIMNI
jgi:hypothetical protein